MTDYEKMVINQINQYKGVNNIHDLPEIFHYWSNKWLRPILSQVMGVDNITEFFGTALLEATGQANQPFRFLSIGSGDCSIEIEVVRWLKQHGLQSFIIECIDLSSYLLEKGQKTSCAQKIEKHLRFLELDVNYATLNGTYTGIMVNHSLHHIIELEHVFSEIKRALLPYGVFVINDMIGRNGHMRWPEALDIINLLWPILPEARKYNHQLSRLEVEYVNWDCSKEGFEGIRAQDILALLIKNFQFRKFLAFGNIPDIFIDRSFGHNFSSQNAQDRAFIDLCEYLNRLLISNGIIKPTMMLAVADLNSTQTVTNANWTPAFCVRPYAQ